MSEFTVSGPAALPAGQLVKAKLSSDEKAMRAGMWAATVALAVALVLPLVFLLWRSFQDRDGNFVGLANFADYVTTPALLSSVWNSAWTASVTALVVVPLAFGYAYALTRSCIPARSLFRSIALLPVLAPSLLPALALIYLCGNQGILTPIFGRSIYGPVGIVVAQIFYTFPHAMLILTVALSTADARLYEAAEVLRASRGRIMRSVTLPGARFGLVSAAVVVFTLVITDFGIPKVIGGDFNVLATDVYKQVVGLQNFNMGAVVGMVLLLPAVGAFLLETWARRQQTGSLSGRAVPYVARPRRMRDRIALGLVLTVSFLLILIVGIAIWGSLIRFWPYNLSLTLRNYEFGRFDFAGWGSLLVSVKNGRHGGAYRHSGGLYRGLSDGARTEGLVADACAPLCGGPASGGAGPGSGAGVYPVLQRALEPAGFHLRHAGDPCAELHRAFLHGVPPDGDDGDPAA